MVHRYRFWLGHFAGGPSADDLRPGAGDRRALELAVRRRRRLSDPGAGRGVAYLSGAVDGGRRRPQAQPGASAFLALVPGAGGLHLWSAAASDPAGRVDDRSARHAGPADLHARSHPGALCADARALSGYPFRRVGAGSGDAHPGRDHVRTTPHRAGRAAQEDGRADRQSPTLARRAAESRRDGSSRGASRRDRADTRAAHGRAANAR